MSVSASEGRVLDGGEVDVSCVDGVGRIEIRRPHVRNALNEPSADAIRAAVDAFGADPACTAILLCGQGGDLSSGADLGEARSGQRPSARTLMLQAIAASARPVIAVVDGWAVGTGVAMVAAATFAVSGRGSRFGLPEGRNGFFPGQVAPYLTRRVRPDVALAWMLRADVLDADQAMAAGLLTSVCDTGHAEQAARELVAGWVGERPVVHAAMQWYRRAN
jgi:enoyl-CoA hydratase/carnithine racemase